MGKKKRNDILKSADMKKSTNKSKAIDDREQATLSNLDEEKPALKQSDLLKKVNKQWK